MSPASDHVTHTEIGRATRVFVYLRQHDGSLVGVQGHLVSPLYALHTAFFFGRGLVGEGLVGVVRWSCPLSSPLAPKLKENSQVVFEYWLVT